MSGLLVLLLCASRAVITEVMANPAGPSGAHQPEDRNEFIELYNPGNEAVDLFDWTVDDGDNTDQLVAWTDLSILDVHPNLRINYTWLEPGRYAVVLDSEYTDPHPEGGHVMPYLFGDSTIVLTTRNTTIGNGLATTDPLIVFSPYGDTTTWGTPDNTGDSIPCNPGDGISWERISPLLPDSVSNWAACLDSAGCTPGRPNSVTLIPDMALSDLRLEQPDSLVPGEAFHALAVVTNEGHVATKDWRLDVFLDLNGNLLPDHGDEPVNAFPGWTIVPAADSTVRARLVCPHRRVDLCARLDCPGDIDTADNLLRITLDPGAGEQLVSLVRPSFSPDGDGYEDSLEIAYRLPETGGTLDVVVFDLGGRKERTLYSDEPEEDRGTLFWDGRDGNGNPSPVGIYALWARYREATGDIETRLPAVLCR